MTEEQWAGIIASIVTGGGLVKLLDWWTARRRGDIEGAGTIVDKTLAWASRLEAENARLLDRIDQLEKRLDQLEADAATELGRVTEERDRAAHEVERLKQVEATQQTEITSQAKRIAELERQVRRLSARITELESR